MKLITSVCMILLLSTTVAARVITVEKDGTGDYQIIQDAVNASAPTDTILIGPGRYDDFWNFRPDLNWDTVIGVTVDSLTIKGVSSDEVIIGPVIPDEPGGVITTHGIASAMDLTWLVVEDISTENTDRGIHLFPSGRIRRCVTRNHWWDGYLIEVGNDIVIEDCKSFDGGGIGFAPYGPDLVKAEVTSFYANNADMGIYNRHPNAILRNITGEDCAHVVSAHQGHTYLTESTMTNCLLGISSHGAFAFDNVFVFGSTLADYLWFSGTIANGTDVVFSGGIPAGQNWGTMAGSQGEINIHNSNIGNSVISSVWVAGHSGPMDAIDLTNNYWGTTSADSIDVWIYDSNDNNPYNTIVEVQYQPFSDVPLSNKKKTMGGIKALFR
ncbi:hypothetical protein HN843_04770 [bacterium]|nr:hypothetical protein [bacterium]